VPEVRIADAGAAAEPLGAAVARSADSAVAFAPVSASDAARYQTAVLAGLAEAQGEHPNNIRVVLAADGPRRLKVDGAELTVVPFRRTFNADYNDDTCCDVAVFGTSTPTPYLVPFGSDFACNRCSAMRKLAEVDINGDGMPDFIFAITVRDPTPVHAEVFVSVRAHMTYCSAPAARDAVEASGALTPKGAVHAIERAVSKAGESILECATEVP
jgi:hypothetical protein